MAKASPKEHVLIVGGTKGAGRAAARMFQAEGQAVSVIARRIPSSAEREGAAGYWAADILNAASTRKALKAIWQQRGPFTSLLFFQRFRGEGDTWDGEIETSLTATKRIIDTLVGDFGFRDGSIVIVSSINAYLISKQLPLGYHIAKAALNQMVRYYAVTLGPRGVRLNSVSPGTFLKDESKDFFLKNKKLVSLYRKMIPLGRICTAEEVIQTVLFLASPKSSFVTGQDIVIDGGVSLVYQETLARELSAL
ncbi:MAG: 3-oxoacyl-[acyl-carrier protein] reductase [Verrucomicrobiota bacterium]